jgi:ubiquinone/menaquinone biosynthesis C-methylase UbiE
MALAPPRMPFNMPLSHARPPQPGATAFVPETAFGTWFLRTYTWQHHVLRVAINDLKRLMTEPCAAAPVILDAGCGQGQSFKLLAAAFQPQRIIGVDLHDASLAAARVAAAQLSAASGVAIELMSGNCRELPLASASVDMVFCHQTFHHLVDQEASLAEFKRVLKPGGTLLFAESTEAYIRSWVIRLLFRHPMEVQKSAEAYLDMIRAHGFSFGKANVSLPYLWWSRSSDFGLLERFGLLKPRPQGRRRETLVNVAAVKGAA